MASIALTPEARAILTSARRVAKRSGCRQILPEHLLVALTSGQSAAAAVLGRHGLHRQLLEDKLRPGGHAGPAEAHALSTGARTILHSAQKLAAGAGTTTVDTVMLAKAIVGSGEQAIAELLASRQLTPGAVLADLANATVSATVGTDTADPESNEDDRRVPAGAAGTNPKTGTPQDLWVDLTALADAGDLPEAYGREKETADVIACLSRRSKNAPCLVGDPGVGKTAVVENFARKIAAGQVPHTLVGRPLWAVDIAGMVAGTRARGDFEKRLKQLLAQAQKKNAILFIDEIHQVMAAGGSPSRGGSPVVDVLKQPLARGTVSLIGATTHDEWRKHISKDSAFARRLNPVTVNEPTENDARTILSKVAGLYEQHHHVSYSQDALNAAVSLSARYLPNRRLPDKALDVIDEAGAASSCRRDDGGNIRIERRHIADVVTAMTGVPVDADPSSSGSLKFMPERLAGRVVGQHRAIDAVCRAVRRRRSGLGEKRPVSFLFTGPTGSGKTQLVNAVADELFAIPGGRGSLIRLDMGEYISSESKSRLVGAPPGYRGYDEGSSLVDKIKQNPYSVVLIDEIEKADRSVFDTFLQVLEDGRLTDGQGRSADFSNAIVVFTSNLGSEKLGRAATGFTGAGCAARDDNRKVRDELKRFFRPEFLNRLDDIIVFNRLSRDDLEQVVALMLGEIRGRLNKRRITLTVADGAIAELLRVGYDPALGARPLRRAIDSLVGDRLADLLISGTVTDGDTVDVHTDDGMLAVSPAGNLAVVD